MHGKSSLLPAEPAATITVATNDDCLTYTVARPLTRTTGGRRQ
jgi:hypothetical protein